MNKKDIQNFISNKIFLSLLCIFLFILGISSIYYASSMSEYPEFERYWWDINAYSENGSFVDFHSFVINHHFYEDKGTLSFKSEGDINKMIIWFPQPLKQKVYAEIMNNSKKDDFRILLIEEEKEDRVTILFEENTSEQWIFLNFDMKLSPSARHRIGKNSYWAGGQVFFDWGEDFVCMRDNCAFNLKNVYYARLDTNSLKSVRLQIDQSGVSGRGDRIYEFETSAKSINKINWKTFLISIGSSLIAGAIFALISILIAIGQEKGK